MSSAIKPQMIISLSPSTYCNLRCGWCYLSKEELANSQLIDLKKLSMTLNYISSFYDIVHVDIYGGEPTLLPVNFALELHELIKTYNCTTNVITNLTTLKHPLLYVCDSVGISYDFNLREFHSLVKENIKLFPRDKHILTLATNDLMSMSHEDIITQLSELSIDSWEIKPYSKSRNNQFDFDHDKYEQFVFDVHASDKPFMFINTDNILSSINFNNVSYSNNHIYITPNSEMCVLDFDENDCEFFRFVPNMLYYVHWCKKEYDKYSKHQLCKACDYQHRCISEHLLVTKELKRNGFPNLIRMVEQC